MENNTFQAGEEIVYKMYYNWNFVWMTAGEVTFRVKDLGDRYHLSVTGNTYPSYDWFFKVRDKYDTYVDKKTLLPSVSVRDVEEGSYRLYDKVTFDRKLGIARSLRGKSVDSTEVAEYKVNQCIHDVLSIFYFSRNVDYAQMAPGQQYPVSIFMDKETWPLKVKYLGKEEGKRVRGMGKFNTLIFNPQVVSGYIFTDDTQLKVWVSDDKNRIPVLIESPLRVGSAKAVLKSYKGLKYPLSAKL